MGLHRYYILEVQLDYGTELIRECDRTVCLSKIASIID